MSDEPIQAPPEETRQSYFAVAASWAQDRSDVAARSMRIAWIIAAVAIAIAIMEALALIALAPLKTVVPYTLLVDRNTGFVQVLRGSQPDMIKPDAALTQSHLAQYVIARETFDMDSLADQYRKVALWSADSARRSYLAWMPRSNPNSPLNIYPATGRVTTQVESVSPIGAQTALVRFRTVRQDSGQAPASPSFWVSVLRYRYVNEPASVEDRIANPLGFQVVSYRRDQEAPPQPSQSLPPGQRPQQPVASDIPVTIGQSPVAPARSALPATERPLPKDYYGDGL